MNITEKLLKARKMIKETSVKKEGKNTFSKYDYFTPSQVSELVNTVCQELGILALFSLRKNKHGLYGELKLVNLDDDETKQDWIITEMRTEMPSITATNMTQQMGGCETYTKRYMLMSAFDITDNNLDFDSQDNRPKQQEATKEPVKTPDKSIQDDDVALNIRLCGTLEELQEVWQPLNKADKIKYENAKTIRKNELTK